MVALTVVQVVAVGLRLGWYVSIYASRHKKIAITCRTANDDVYNAAQGIVSGARHVVAPENT